MGVISKGFLVRKKVVWSFNTLQSDFKIRKSAAEEVGWDRLSDLFERLRQRLDEIDG